MGASELRVVVIGAGIGGLSRGLALRERGIAADVFETGTGADRDRCRHRAVGQHDAGVRPARPGRQAVNHGHDPYRADLPRLAYGRPDRRAPGGEGRLVRAAVRRPYFGIHRADLQKTLGTAFGLQNLHLGCRLVGIVFANGRVERGDAIYSGTSASRGIVPTENLPSLPDPHAIQFWMARTRTCCTTPSVRRASR